MQAIDDLKPHAAEWYSSQSAAMIAMKDVVRKDARLAGKLQVVSTYEMAA